MKKVSLLSFLVLSLAFIPVRDVKAQNIAREFQANINESNYYLDAFPSKQAISATTAPEIAQTAEVAEKTTPRIESIGKPPVKPLEPKQPRVPSIIQVLSPNGRENWETGIRYTIRWTSKGIKGNVKIMLKRPDRSYKIAESVPNTGSYSYTVHKNIPQGSNYTVHIMTLDGKVKDWSDKYFSITKREIIVLAPNGGEKLEQGREYTVRWRTSGRIEKVNIEVLGMEKKATCYYTVGKNVPNTGSYRWMVSPMSSRTPSPRPGVRCPVLQKGKYKLHISATKGRVGDESDGRFEIIPPEVELTCGFLKYGKVTKKKFYVFYGEREEYIRFEVFVENKGRGKKILSRVPFMWTMLKQPRNIVILQHEAGFGDVYPNRRYTTTFKYNIKKIKAYPGYVGKERKLKKGDYSFVFEVDPRNELREPEWTRKNNKCEVNFKIK